MIPRARLLDQIDSGGPAIWLVEAGAGFGKTVLLDNLTASGLNQPLIVMRKPVSENSVDAFLTELADAARRAQHADSAEILAQATADPRSIVEALETAGHGLAIDDVQAWNAEVHTIITGLAAISSGRFRLLLAGRRCPIPAPGPAVHHIGADELALTVQEITAQLDQAGIASPGDVAIVLRQTSHGWPLAVTSTVQRMGSAPQPATIARELSNHRNVIDNLLTTNLSAADPAAAELAHSLASLPFFDQEIAAALGASAVLDSLLEAGLTITARSDGWSEVAEPFRSSLERTSPLTGPPPPAVLDRFVERGEVATALNQCLAHGERAQAARLIASLTMDQQMFIEPDALQAAMIEIGDEARAAPRCLLNQALLNGTHGRMKEAYRCLERGAELFASIDPDLHDKNHIEFLLELGVWKSNSGDLDGAAQLSERTAAHVGASKYLQAKAHDLKGVIASYQGTPESLEVASTELTASLELWRELGETRLAAVTAFRLASGALTSLGRRAEAMALLDNLSLVGDMTLLNNARLGLERAVLMPYLGRADEVEAVLADVRRIAGLLGYDWLITWALWVEIVTTSVQGRATEAIALFDRYVDEGRQMVDEFAQTIMWCEASEAMARVGAFDRAKSALDRTRDFRGMDEWFMSYYRASYLARSGRPEQAQHELDELQVNSEVEREKRWAIDLLRAYCAWQLNDQAGAMKLLDQCVDECRALDQPMLASYVERDIVAKLQTDPSDVPAIVEGPRILLGGDFGVDGPNGPLDRPVGHSATILKVLVLNRGRITLDQAIDVLWPEVAPNVGRRRLRNVLGRLRQTHGELVLRVDESLELAAEVGSDYADAAHAVDLALQPTSDRRMVEAALRLLDEPLLPDDRYEDWAEHARQQREAMSRTTSMPQPMRSSERIDWTRLIQVGPTAPQRYCGLRVEKPQRLHSLSDAASSDVLASCVVVATSVGSNICRRPCCLLRCLRNSRSFRNYPRLYTG